MGALSVDGRRREQLLEVDSLVASAPDLLVARRRILECISDEVADGLDEEGERHVSRLCTLLAAAEARRLAARTEREFADLLDLYHRVRRELGEADDARLAAGVLARSVVPVLADVCIVDLAEGPDAFRREAVEVSHLVSDARRVKAALENLPGRRHAPHDPRVVARTGTSRLPSDVCDEDLVCASSTPEHIEALRSLGPTGYLCVPLKSSGAVVGAMTLLRVRTGRAFTGPHKRLAQALGEIYHEAAPPLPASDRAPTAAPPQTQNGTGGRAPMGSGPSMLDLTRRELEVLKLMNRGYSREALARRLSISVKTYDNHTINIRAKLGADNNLAALARARAAGIDLDD